VHGETREDVINKWNMFPRPPFVATPIVRQTSNRIIKSNGELFDDEVKWNIVPVEKVRCIIIELQQKTESDPDVDRTIIKIQECIFLLKFANAFKLRSKQSVSITKIVATIKLLETAQLHCKDLPSLFYTPPYGIFKTGVNQLNDIIVCLKAICDDCRQSKDTMAQFKINFGLYLALLFERLTGNPPKRIVVDNKCVGPYYDFAHKMLCAIGALKRHQTAEYSVRQAIEHYDSGNIPKWMLEL